jgi:hypothetical protein
MDPQALLMTIAQVAATFIGFTGVIFAIGRYSQGGGSDSERNAVLNLLLPATAALFLAFLPLVAATAFSPGPASWRICNAVLAAVHLPLVSSAARLAWRKQLLEPIPLRFVLIPGGFVAVAANVVVAIGALPGLAVLAYVAGLIWFLLISAIQLGTLILSHTRAA